MNQEFATLAAPVASLTWEVTEDLPNNELETGRLPLSFRGPVEILGCYPSVIAKTLSNPVKRIPTPDDIVCQIDINQEERLTNRLEQGGSATQGVAFVTLASLSTQLPRLLRKILKDAKPEVGITFRWKIDPAAGVQYENARVSLALFVRYCDEKD